MPHLEALGVRFCNSASAELREASNKLSKMANEMRPEGSQAKTFLNVVNE
jgi:hypothetical protein